jgi:hypothetical protein
MRRFCTILTLAVLLLCLSGCGPKPESVVELYLKKVCTNDIAGAKKLCTGAARDFIQNIHADLEVQKVMAAGVDNSEAQAQPTWEEMMANIEITLEEKTKKTTTIYVKTETEEVQFVLKKVGGKWMIYSISNPRFGMPIKH